MNKRTPSILTFAFASLFLFTLAPSAEAQRARRDRPFAGTAALFGADGQLVVSSDVALTLRKRNNDGTHLELVPAFDYFVVPHLSVGGFVALSYDSRDDGHTSSFSLGPRVGYDIPLSELFSFWPKAGLSYGSTTNTYRVNIGGNNFADASTSSSGLALNIYAPFLLHPVPHFFIGFGPFIDAGLGGDSRPTEFGARLTIGGWL